MIWVKPIAIDFSQFVIKLLLHHGPRLGEKLPMKGLNPPVGCSIVVVKIKTDIQPLVFFSLVWFLCS